MPREAERGDGERSTTKNEREDSMRGAAVAVCRQPPRCDGTRARGGVRRLRRREGGSSTSPSSSSRRL